MILFISFTFLFILKISELNYVPRTIKSNWRSFMFFIIDGVNWIKKWQINKYWNIINSIMILNWNFLFQFSAVKRWIQPFPLNLNNTNNTSCSTDKVYQAIERLLLLRIVKINRYFVYRNNFNISSAIVRSK